MQVTLLRFLESGEYLRLGETQVRRADVRIIAATNRVLRGAEGEKLFRRDLLFRLNEIEIRLPALRERARTSCRWRATSWRSTAAWTARACPRTPRRCCVPHAWPGNVRELENVMKRVAALHGARRWSTPGAFCRSWARLRRSLRRPATSVRRSSPPTRRPGQPEPHGGPARRQPQDALRAAQAPPYRASLGKAPGETRFGQDCHPVTPRVTVLQPPAK